MHYFLFSAIGFALLGLLWQAWAFLKFRRHVERELHRNGMAHERIVKRLPMAPPPLDWGDDRLRTRKLDSAATFQPVDFRHRRW